MSPRRRNNGRTIQVGPANAPKTVDNRWVVPYNKALLLKYHCHINVEVWTSVSAVKYIHKYVYKGHDRAEVEMVRADAGGAADGGADGAGQRVVDEIKKYLDGRYVSATEAIWRILNFRLHFESPSVERLPVHAEGGHLVIFPENRP